MINDCSNERQINNGIAHDLPVTPLVWLQFTRFLGAGCISAIGHYGILISLVQLANMDAVVASSIGAMIGAILNYLANYRLTFQSTCPHRQSLPRFFAVAVSGLLLNILLMWIGIDFLQINYLLSQLATTTLALLWSFGMHRFWTFCRQS